MRTEKAPIMWRDKAKSIIAQHAHSAWLAANTAADGRRRKRHVPYTLPPIAAALVVALNTDDEAEAKRLFIVEATGTYSLV